jgi:hypothetical protein
MAFPPWDSEGKTPYAPIRFLSDLDRADCREINPNETRTGDAGAPAKWVVVGLPELAFEEHRKSMRPGDKMNILITGVPCAKRSSGTK